MEYEAIYPGRPWFDTHIMPPYTREGIAHMERNGKHYIFSSGIQTLSPRKGYPMARFTDEMEELRLSMHAFITDGCGTSLPQFTYLMIE